MRLGESPINNKRKKLYSMKIVAIVPIKLNNMRCPNKNTRVLGKGKPLCQYILNTLLQVKQIDEIYVYCSSEDIQKYLPQGVQYLKRSQDLDRDEVKMNEVLERFAKEVPADVYVMTHATSPFVKPGSIETGIAKILEGKYDSAFAAKKVCDFFWKDGKPMNYQLDAIPRTQDLPPMWQETSGFYIYCREIMVEKKRRIGDNPFIVEVDEIESIDIDEPIDFEIASVIGDKFFYKN